MKSDADKLARRRAYWHATKTRTRVRRLRYRREWYSKTKGARRGKIREYGKTSYFRHREKKLLKNMAWREKNRGRLLVYRRDYSLRSNFGITAAQYDAMLSEQGGVCLICKQKCRSGRRLAVDHCHRSGKLRGLLCGNCNNMLGRCGDSVAVLTEAISYLNKHLTSTP